MIPPDDADDDHVDGVDDDGDDVNVDDDDTLMTL